MNSLIVSNLARVELFSYPYHKQLKKELYESLLQYKDKQNHETNVKATMTEWNLISPGIQKLKDYIIESLENLPPDHDWGHFGNFEFKTFWANIYRHGEYTVSHCHVPEDLTVVYFLTSAAGDAPLLLDDSKTQIHSQEGLFALFPGYIYHSVPKHMSQVHERITLSGDISRIRK